jgi:hypothetical protein
VTALFECVNDSWNIIYERVATGFDYHVVPGKKPAAEVIGPTTATMKNNLTGSFTMFNGFICSYGLLY